MRFSPLSFIFPLLLSGLTLTGCGGGGGSSSVADTPAAPGSVTVSGYVVNGPLADARVRVYRGETQLGETRTDADGHYTLVVAGAPPLRIVTDGGLLDGEPYPAQLAADCADAAHCDATPWTTVIARLVDEHGFNNGDARALIANRLGSDDDPFLAMLPDHAPVAGFDLDEARTFIAGGAQLRNWVDAFAGWAVDTVPAPPPGIGVSPPASGGGPPGGDGGDGEGNGSGGGDSGNGGDNGGGPGTLPTHTVSASAGTGGTIVPASRSVSHGASASFTLTAEAGYAIDTVSGCGGSLAGAVYTTAAIDANCSIEAHFRLDLTAPADLQAVENEESVTLSWSPVVNADNYDLYYATDPDFDPAAYAAYENGTLRLGVGAGPITLDELEGGVPHFFAVGARAGALRGPVSAVLSATPKQICSGNGVQQPDGSCVCNSGLFTGSRCQVALRFERMQIGPGESAPIAEPGPAYAFGVDHNFGFGPALPPGDRYTFTVEIVENGFSNLRPGIQVGVIALPRAGGASGLLLGKSRGEWAYDSSSAYVWQEGRGAFTGVNFSHTPGYQVRAIVDRRPGINVVTFEEKPVGRGAFSRLAIIVLPATGDLNLAVSALPFFTTSRASVRLVE